MPINFPDTPVLNDEFIAEGRAWRWSGTTWDAITTVVVGPTGPQGDQGTNGIDGVTGPRGLDTANSFKYTITLSNGTISASAGTITSNNLSLMSTSTFGFSFTDSDALDVQASLTAAMSSTSANKATLTIRDASNVSNFAQFTATTFYPSAGEARIDVTPVSSNGVIANATPVLITIDRAGDIGQIPNVSSFVTLTDAQTVTAKTFGYSFDAGSVVTTASTPTTLFFTTSANGVQYWTSNLTQNFTLNFCVDSSYVTPFNSRMAVGDTMSLVGMFTNGATAYRPTAFQIDGVSVTPKWVGGTAPTAGNVNSVDMYSFNIIKTAANTYTVLASQTKFA